MSEDGFRSMYVTYANTAWTEAWVAAVDANDAVGTATALEHWQQMVDLNRHVFADPADADRFIDAARAGDVEAVRHDLEINGSWWMADLLEAAGDDE